MSRAVIDCSALVDNLVAGSARGFDGMELHAPTLLDYEFASVAARLDRRSPHGAPGTAMMTQASRLTIVRHDAERLIPSMWSTRHRISLYDGAYVALSRLLGAPLVTRDRKLASVAIAYCDVLVPD